MNKQQSKDQRATERLTMEKSILLGRVVALLLMSLVACEKKVGTQS
jgi:hypothetical protein